ncbi:hypothetical protein PVAP13_5KG096774 [Panicum virgatum]|uniref:Uncharacterized protein n=1 Tax=Panicum virgatum TaxID=38727 RepID=A0A8T0SEB7_PANVG|nr:hypothetical protein PVAP13_5KG096774 [Panicum virgatum]
MGNRPGGGGDFGRAKRRRQDLEIARGGSREIGEGVGLLAHRWVSWAKFSPDIGLAERGRPPTDSSMKTLGYPD